MLCQLSESSILGACRGHIIYLVRYIIITVAEVGRLAKSTHVEVVDLPSILFVNLLWDSKCHIL